MSPSVESVRYDTFSTKLVGASGAVIIVAPVPAYDAGELPFSFVAKTFAEMTASLLSENGAAVSVDNGIVHLSSEIIVLSEPLQST